MTEADSPVLGLLQQQVVPVFMLANQLPLLQLGYETPTVTNQIDDFCSPTGSRYGDRLFQEVKIVAFSDPNDVLSYAIPRSFVLNYMDSRICPNVSNVVINVAQPISIPIVGPVTNPMTAHSDYEIDERVIEIIAQGVQRGDPENRIPAGCSWIETRETEPVASTAN